MTMILESNNYDLDTLLVYYQDSAITARQLIEHASEDMLEEYNAYLAKRNLDDTEEEAEKFLDWWMDEERATEEEDLLDEQEEDEIQSPETNYPWEDDENLRRELVFGPASHKVCLWRYKNPMDLELENCAKDTELPVPEVRKWWNIPDYINFKKGYRFVPTDQFDEETLKNLLLII